ncbi:ABC transporter ATP-binding protein [Frankia sp. Cas3]|uniref:ABC transporter ATP-binding protein n=1 Tax=Frankia sp. Cas3 TaxID=3073926 RepID=UPI002AD291AF|nr:ABC transporter ATP-binding protein [Frankia sp. Cas3]
MTSMNAVRLDAVTKIYRSKVQTTTALTNVTVSFPAGSFTAVVGRSGSGKSTLLHCAAGLDRPTSGTVTLAGIALTGLSETAVTRLRRDHTAFVFQAFNLMPSLTLRQNVELPLRLIGHRPDPEAIGAALGAVGLADRAASKPSELSGGEQQRVAIARALVSQPQVLFADEPTAQLDVAASQQVLGALRRLVDERQQTIVLVTHDPAVAARADRVVVLSKGRVAELLEAPAAEDVAACLLPLEGMHAC